MKEIKKSTDFIKTAFGNILEWYDFSLYGIFAVSIASNFFGNHSQFVALLMTFLTFSISFVARPIGSIIFGKIGDKIGKKYSVNLSVWCMAVPTVLIGLIPSYHQIGTLAPILLLTARFIQGISVGGQFSGLITIASENAKGRRSYFIGLILAISTAGSLLASFVGLVSYGIAHLTPYHSLAWRMPFVLSGVLFFIYLKLNPKIEKEEVVENYSLKSIFQEQPQELLYLTILAAVMSSIYYILYSYSVTFMEITLKLTGSQPLIILNILTFISLFLYVFFGKLADKSKDRIRTVKRAALILGLFVIFLSTTSNFVWVLISLTGIVIVYACVSSYMTSMFAELFHEKYKMTACSLSYSGGAVIAGFSPSIAEIATKGSQSGFYMLLLSLAFALYLVLDKIPELNGYKKYILN